MMDEGESDRTKTLLAHRTDIRNMAARVATIVLLPVVGNAAANKPFDLMLLSYLSSSHQLVLVGWFKALSEAKTCTHNK